VPALVLGLGVLVPPDASRAETRASDDSRERRGTSEPAGGEQAEPPPASLLSDEIVVTATAGERSPDEVPAIVSVASARELAERRLVRALLEALVGSPGVAVQKTSNGQASPYLRGFTGFRTLLLVDGIRVNNSAFRDGPNEYWGLVDLHAAERLELVLGPGSALYGSDAVGGTVALFTPNAAEGGADLGGSIALRGASAERSGLGHVRARGRVGERFGWSVGGTYGEFGDLEAAGEVGRQRRSGYGFEAVDLKGRWAVASERTVTVAHQSSRLDDVWRTHTTIFGRPWRGTRLGSDLERTFDFARELTYLQVEDRIPRRLADSVWASLSWQRLEEEQVRVTSTRRREQSEFEVGTAGVQLRFAKESRAGGLTYGVDAYLDRVDSARTSFDAAGALLARDVQGPVADDSTYESTGLYLQDELTLSSRWSFVGGVRIARVRLEAGAFEDPVTRAETSLVRSWSATVGNLRALVRLGEAERWRAWIGWGQAFRAPNLSDLTRLEVARSGELETAAPGLDPERFTTLELGLRYATPAARANLALYRTEAEGMIVRVPTGATSQGLTEVTKRNAGDGRIRGIDFTGEIALGEGFRLSAAGSWLEDEVDGYPTAAPERVREPLDKAMAPWARLTLAWEPPAGRGWLAAELQRTAEQDRLSSRDRADSQRIPPGGSPGYTLWGVRGGWSFGAAVRLSVALENLTDEEYRVHGSGIHGSGRNLVVGFAADF
jgi:hemoglobin/transferrin/lactoferrin receptor protein